MSGAVAVFAPTTLLTVTVECSASGDEQLHVHVGGQGVWVARMVARLDVPVTLCTTFGGETGQVARTLLDGQGITLASVATEAWNGGYVHDRRSGDREELADVVPGPLLRHELDDLYSLTLAAALDAGVCVLTGTHLAPVVPDRVYQRLAHDLRQVGVDTVADLSGGQLDAAVDGGLRLVKVSEEDLRRDGRLPAGDPHDVEPPELDGVLADLGRTGAEVVVSRGERPAVAVVDRVRYRVTTPVMDVVDHRGAGDAMTGALAAGFALGYPAEQRLRLGAAAGAATVVRHGYATGTKAAIEGLARRIEVRACAPDGSASELG